jgi:hypothetical protein
MTKKVTSFPSQALSCAGSVGVISASFQKHPNDSGAKINKNE